ncbi:unnamed protein product [Dovyalis caffra]|uniref:Uncharacterized protein n=1 Tax=Dovyalis caffra TaxID=77055 RepID=A0AAV1SFG3_9ROSI|nr:unnamed protein product [Dovyalis caffra]
MVKRDRSAELIKSIKGYQSKLKSQLNRLWSCTARRADCQSQRMLTLVSVLVEFAEVVFVWELELEEACPSRPTLQSRLGQAGLTRMAISTYPANLTQPKKLLLHMEPSLSSPFRR